MRDIKVRDFPDPKTCAGMTKAFLKHSALLFSAQNFVGFPSRAGRFMYFQAGVSPF